MERSKGLKLLSRSWFPASYQKFTAMKNLEWCSLSCPSLSVDMCFGDQAWELIHNPEALKRNEKDADKQDINRYNELLNLLDEAKVWLLRRLSTSARAV